MRKPRFIHDCKSCIYLGRYLGLIHDRRLPADLYFCPGEYTVLARYGDEPDSYSAGIPIWKFVRPLEVAVYRAILRGIIRSSDSRLKYYPELVQIAKQLEEQLE
jgi:hypothetical protein